MKRINNLYDNMISYSNIMFVFNNIKRKCHNKNKIMRFIRYKNCYFVDILLRLKNNSYEFSKYNIFLIHEKKYRIIMSESISDKIVNQMVSYFVLLPSLNCLIDENIATRSGKGSSYGYKLFEKYIDSIGINNDIYVLRVDIKKYFYNINHDILISMLERRIKDKKSIEIIKQIISLTDQEYVNQSIINLINNEINRVNKLNITNSEKQRLINELRSIPLYRKGYGLSIGCLSNQLLAVFYLNDLDYYIKEILKCKYYIRYMDDLYILSNDREYLKNCFDVIKTKLLNIELNINDKSGIYRLKEGVSFLGYTYCIKNNKLLIRYDNTTIKTINRKINKLYKDNFNDYYKSVCSYKGYFTRCNTNLYFDKYSNICFNNRYDKYLLLKSKYNDYKIFIKKKNKYYNYENHKWYKNINDIDKCVILEGNNIVLYVR